MTTAADFNKDLEQAQEFEEIFREAFGLLPPEDRTHDAITTKGTKIELKFDFKIAQTGNFFFETASDYNSSNCGGFYRAAKDSIPIFIYVDVANEIAYLFETEQLMEQDFSKYPLRLVQNENYQTEGNIVPKTKIQALFRAYNLNSRLQRNALQKKLNCFKK